MRITGLSDMTTGVAGKELSLLKTINAKHRSKFAALSPAMVTVTAARLL
jgi:hypothetical protein